MAYKAPDGAPPQYGMQQPEQVHYDQGPAGGDPRGYGGYQSPPPQQYGSPSPYQQGPYGPPQGQYGPPQGQYGQQPQYGQPMQYQQQPMYPPQQQQHQSSSGGGICAGIMGACACCLCLDCLF